MAITHVALDDSKRVIVAGILRGDATQPELREIPNDLSGYDLYRQLTALSSPPP